MNDLQKLALRHISDLSEDLDNKAIDVGSIVGRGKEEFDPKKHTYPISFQAREIQRWAQAIIDSDKK